MTLKRLIGTYLALIVLLAATAALHLTELGLWNVVLNLGIATAKAVLIALVFMHLWHDTSLIRAFALVGAAWLMLLIILSLTDYLHRDQPAAFYGREAPPQAVERSLHDPSGS